MLGNHLANLLVLYTFHIGPQRKLTRLLALCDLSGTASQKAHHMLGSVQLLITGTNAPPDKQSCWGFQHEHIVGVQVGSAGLDLREKHVDPVRGRLLKMSAQWPTRMQQHHQWVCWQTANLHSPGSVGGALSDVEEASAAGLRLSTFA